MYKHKQVIKILESAVYLRANYYSVKVDDVSRLSLYDVERTLKKMDLSPLEQKLFDGLLSGKTIFQIAKEEKTYVGKLYRLLHKNAKLIVKILNKGRR